MFVSCLFIFDEGQHPEPTVGCLSKSMSLPGCKYSDVFLLFVGRGYMVIMFFGTFDGRLVSCSSRIL